MLCTARGPWLHASLLATWLARGAAAASPLTPPLEPIESIADPRSIATPTEDPRTRVGALINEGQALFDTADYVGAIDRWTEAYAQLPAAPHLAAARNLLAYQIAQAHIEAFAMDPQTTHLRKAERLLLQYIAGLDPSETEPRLDAEQRLATVQAQVEAAAAAARIRAAAARPTPPPLAPIVRRAPSGARPLLLLGGVSLGLGCGLLAGTAVAAVTAADLHDGRRQALMDGAREAERGRLLLRETRAQQTTIVTAVVGGALITTGIALLIASRARSRGLSALPMLSPTLVGARLSLRF